MTAEKWIDRLAQALSWVGAICLTVMMLATILDVGLRAVFGTPVFGTFETVELMLVGVVFLALPEVFLKDQHVTVDVVDQVVPARVSRLLKAAAALLTLGFVAVLGWNMAGPALDAAQFGETTLDLKLPIWIFWAPMLLGLAASLLAALVSLLRVIGGSGDVS